MNTRRQLRDARRLRSRRIRALLAGGLVLGVGAAATLAAWNDSEFGSGSFTAGTFNIVGATDGATFSQHPTSPGATLSFALPTTAGAMTPGDKVYALFSVKTVTPSMAGTVQLKAASGNASGLGAQLTYTVKTVSTTNGCTAANWASIPVTTGLPSGAALTVGATSTQVLNKDGGNQINYCFEFVMNVGAPTTVQGTSQTATWELAATSTP
ncbi:hypothetical protein RS84_00467 [Microbacterium hydrocarbonoxydans]|uniref:SipW-cognate class signal peptide n=1 Tax=Microbacterium hydrocarbonoxydans TaxID=273678 RepID=A0A0M2HWM0_9MICO|nr:SipW-dependent-type signal peptide-containing protein [Microbacterium hydrocarbonoxydans]KJL48839.1 hypothetical protein RS84_00467 [Microbacterium hydrocarbonoxydans]